jgi:hypothetical protein
MINSDIEKYKEEMYRMSYPQNSSFWAQGRIDQRFKAGDQDLWNEIIGTNKYRSKYQFFFNLIRRQVNMVVGYYRQHRKSIISVPRMSESQQDSDDMTKVMMHTNNRMNYDEIDAKCFEGAVTAGQDFIHLYKDTRYDPISGDFACDHVGFQNILTDPYYRKIDLSDCNFLWRRRWLADIQKIMPKNDFDEAILKSKGQRDGKFPMQAQAMGNLIEYLNYVDEFYYKTTREAVYVSNVMTGQSKEWLGDRDEIEHIAKMQPWLMVSDVEIPTVKLCISINGKQVYDGENQLGIDRYPFVPYLCYHEPDISAYAWKTQGIVRGLRHVQYLYNRRKVIEFDILESQPNSGYIYKPKHLVNPKEVFKTGQGQGIALKEQADQMSLQKITPPDIPATVVQLSELLTKDMLQISGVNEELLGAAEDDKAGILAQVRQGAGLTTLQTIFDQSDFTKKIYGEVLSEAIVKNYTTAKITSILGRKPSPSFFDADTLKYGVQIEEGVYSTTQRQLALKQAAYFREILGIQIPDQFFIDKANLPDKNEILQFIEQQQQQQMQQAQLTMQTEQQKQQVEQQETMSKTAENMASVELKGAQAQKYRQEAGSEDSESDLKGAKTLLMLQELQDKINNPGVYNVESRERESAPV